jgi:hypothetical protein
MYHVLYSSRGLVLVRKNVRNSLLLIKITGRPHQLWLSLLRALSLCQRCYFLAKNALPYTLRTCFDYPSTSLRSLSVLSSYLFRLPFDLASITCRTLFVLRSCFVRSTRLYSHCILPCMHAAQQFHEQLNNCGPQHIWFVCRPQLFSCSWNCCAACMWTCMRTYVRSVTVCPSYGVPTDSRYLC